MEFLVGELIGFRDRNDAVHILEADEVFRGKAALVAHHADDGDLRASGEMSVQPAVLNVIRDGFYAVFRCVRLHDDDHSFFLSAVCGTVGKREPFGTVRFFC